MQRIVSGIQPSGVPTLGNYLGALRNWVTLQDDHDCLYCVVDLHALTQFQDPKTLAKSSREMAAALIALRRGPNPTHPVLAICRPSACPARLDFYVCRPPRLA